MFFENIGVNQWRCRLICIDLYEQNEPMNVHFAKLTTFRLLTGDLPVHMQWTRDIREEYSRKYGGGSVLGAAEPRVLGTR